MKTIAAAAIFGMFLIYAAFFPTGSISAADRHGEIPLDEVLDGFDTETSEKSNRDQNLDSVLEGFDDTSSGTTDDSDDATHGFEKRKPEKNAGSSTFDTPWWDPDGYVKLGATVNIAHTSPEPGKTDHRGLSRFRGELQFDVNPELSKGWEFKIGAKAFYDAVYRMRGRDGYTEQVIDGYESELDLRECYLLGRVTASLDVRLGRQIVVWGKSDNIRITDVINPLDLREPGLTDIEDLRLPVAMTRLDYYFGDWSLTGIAVYEHRFNNMPEYGSDFYSGSKPPPAKDVPAHTIENTEWALALSGIFSGWDLSFYLAGIFDDSPHAESDRKGSIQQSHSRLNMFGAAYNVALGNWLVKAEAAFLHGFRFFNEPDKRYSRIDALIGVEYSGFSETSISLEVADRHRFDFSEKMESPPDDAVQDELQTAIRYTRDFRNDTLTFTALLLAFGPTGEDGAMGRTDLEYDITDRVQVRGGVVLYWAGDLRQYQGIGDNDRVFIEVKRYF